MLNYSISEENYIKAIFHLQGQEGTVTTNELSAHLKTRPASVTDMMKKLKAKKLLLYTPYKGFRLSQEGNKVALGIIRRHRLWEYFLAEKLRFTWNEVHAVAEDLEHVSSKKLIDALDEFLGFPRVDPHGDPIPDASGKIEAARQVGLNELPLNKPGFVSHVINQSSGILEMLRDKNISIGTRVEVRKKFEYDHSLELLIGNTKGRSSRVGISEQLAKNIFVKI
jgi:DtxR family Mn-dependent transcriptional regulator